MQYTFIGILFVTEGFKTRRFLDIELEAQIAEGLSSLQFLNSHVREISINCRVLTRF